MPVCRWLSDIMVKVKKSPDSLLFRSVIVGSNLPLAKAGSDIETNTTPANVITFELLIESVP